MEENKDLDSNKISNSIELNKSNSIKESNTNSNPSEYLNNNINPSQSQYIPIPIKNGKLNNNNINLMQKSVTMIKKLLIIVKS